MQNDSRKEEFQRYLEKSGVIDSLTKVLVGLYELPEKPVNAIDFIKVSISSPNPLPFFVGRCVNGHRTMAVELHTFEPSLLLAAFRGFRVSLLVLFCCLTSLSTTTCLIPYLRTFLLLSTSVSL